MVFVTSKATKEVGWLKMFLIGTKGSSLGYIIQYLVFNNNRLVA